LPVTAIGAIGIVTMEIGARIDLVNAGLPVSVGIGNIIIGQVIGELLGS
jgi:hypothetical protein